MRLENVQWEKEQMSDSWRGTPIPCFSQSPWLSFQSFSPDTLFPHWAWRGYLAKFVSPWRQAWNSTDWLCVQVLLESFQRTKGHVFQSIYWLAILLPLAKRRLEFMNGPCQCWSGQMWYEIIIKSIKFMMIIKCMYIHLYFSYICIDTYAYITEI
jgi:hypothetical protein